MKPTYGKRTVIIKNATLSVGVSWGLQILSFPSLTYFNLKMKTNFREFCSPLLVLSFRVFVREMVNTDQFDLRAFFFPELKGEVDMLTKKVDALINPEERYMVCYQLCQLR